MYYLLLKNEHFRFYFRFWTKIGKITEIRFRFPLKNLGLVYLSYRILYLVATLYIHRLTLCTTAINI